MTREEFWLELDRPRRPAQIWQRPFGYDPAHYERLSELAEAVGELPGKHAFDLESYIEDLTYVMETQLPVLLHTWSMNLLGETALFAYYAELFWLPWREKPLGPTGVLDLLSKTQQRAFQWSIGEAILEAIDRERRPKKGGRASAYCERWLRELGSFSTVCHGLPFLWEKWWHLDTAGRAIGALQYISFLMYEDSANPIFPAIGGGPPCLWEESSSFIGKPWLPENVRFLRAALVPNQIPF